MRKKYATNDFKFLTTFKYQPSIRFDITNYSEEIKKASHKEAICHCHKYVPYIHDIGHVITGDLSIVKNRKLRQIFSKGLKFIEPIFHNKAQILNSIKHDLTVYVKGLSENQSINIKFFTPWKVTII